MSRPLVARTRAELEAALGRASSDRGSAEAHSHSDEGARGRVALVPTMGALHAGHASLLSTARGMLDPSDALVVSIFVNPLQFGPGEDLDRYPRSFDADLAICAAEGADVVFAPGVVVVPTASCSPRVGAPTCVQVEPDTLTYPEA